MSKELKLFRDSWGIKDGSKWEELVLEDTYTKGFLDEVNSCTHSPSSDYVNELFLYYYVKYRELKEAKLEVTKASSSWNSKLTDRVILFYLKREYRLEVNQVGTIIVNLQALLAFIFCLLLAFFIAVFLPFYFLTKSNFRSALDRDTFRSYGEVFLIRSKSGYSRAKEFITEKPRCLVLIDNFSGLNVPGKSIYSILYSLSFPRIYSITLWYVVRDSALLYKDAQGLLGGWFALSVFSDYWKKIPHKALYEACFCEILNFAPENVNFFSSEKEDRFALQQSRCCRHWMRHLTCLPHGLEYGYRFPGGLCGDVFYCFSENAKNTLQSIYSSQKFSYSDDVLNKMLGVNKTDGHEKTTERICFFTEPRDQHVNIQIIDELIRMGVKFSIKLHPLEDQAAYTRRFPQIDIIQMLDEALSSSVCLSRKSTVLLEASQREKLAIAILISKKDRFYVEHLFPSLSSKKIVKVTDAKELIKVLLAHKVEWKSYA
jgi:hypothetical protein